LLLMLFIYTGNAAYIWPCWLVLLAMLYRLLGYFW
jgi:hypothetical protein